MDSSTLQQYGMLMRYGCWFKHILLVNTKGSGVAKLRRKPSPTYTHTFAPLNTYYQEMRYQITYAICIP